jgi:Icc-related predicted phosphoesterase
MKLEGLQIDAISDTHTKHSSIKLPGGDMLIHAGDVSWRGKPGEILPFLDWYQKQGDNYEYLVLIPGNHDFGFEEQYALYENECRRRDIFLLNDSGIELAGIKIWGSPVQPWFHNWAFNRQRGLEIQKHWDLIPSDTELLITHGPPKGILDLTDHGDAVGCEDLLNKILEIQVKCHIFGHIHEARGYTYQHERLFVNASSLDGHYNPEPEGAFRIVRGIDGIYLIDR